MRALDIRQVTSPVSEPHAQLCAGRNHVAFLRFVCNISAAFVIVCKYVVIMCTKVLRHYCSVYFVISTALSIVFMSQECAARIMSHCCVFLYHLLRFRFVCTNDGVLCSYVWRCRVVQRAILDAKTDADLITALELVKGEDEWEEQPDLYDWYVSNGEREMTFFFLLLCRGLCFGLCFAVALLFFMKMAARSLIFPTRVICKCNFL